MRLSVPLVEPLQEDGFSCIPRCVKMILLFIAESFPEGRIPDFDLEKIGKIIDTREDGTYPEMVLNLNTIQEFASSIPSIEFEYNFKWHELNEIEKELDEEQPPIVMIDLKDNNQHSCKHAVVVTEVNKPNNLIYYNDPIHGERNMYIPDFLASWDKWDRELLNVKIGKKKQRMLEEFGKEE